MHWGNLCFNPTCARMYTHLLWQILNLSSEWGGSFDFLFYVTPLYYKVLPIHQQQNIMLYQTSYRAVYLDHAVVIFRPLNILLLLTKRCNLYKVLACSSTFFQQSLICTTLFQLRTFMLFISSETPSSQLVLVLPIGLLDMGFQFNAIKIHKSKLEITSSFLYDKIESSVRGFTICMSVYNVKTNKIYDKQLLAK